MIDPTRPRKNAMKRRRLPVSWLIVVSIASAWANWPRIPLPDGTRVDRVVVRKGARVLELFRGTELTRSYSVSLGRSPVGAKAQEGDGRTPEGDYRLDDRKLDSAFHRALHISYPRPSDQAAAEVRGVAPGGQVMIHGIKNGLGWLGRAHLAVDWTNGCIAVTNREIEEILRVVPDGTPIRIVP